MNETARKRLTNRLEYKIHYNCAFFVKNVQLPHCIISQDIINYAHGSLREKGIHYLLPNLHRKSVCVAVKKNVCYVVKVKMKTYLFFTSSALLIT